MGKATPTCYVKAPLWSLQAEPGTRELKAFTSGMSTGIHSASAPLSPLRYQGGSSAQCQLSLLGLGKSLQALSARLVCHFYYFYFFLIPAKCSFLVDNTATLEMFGGWLRVI